MLTRAPILSLLAVGFLLISTSSPILAMQANPAHTHIGHVTTGFPAAPDGQGLLPTLQAELEIAQAHIALAARDATNLPWMQTHAAHVLHAVDPTQIEQGPGLGFGVIAAAEGVAQHIELAAGSEGASDNVRTHAAHIAEAARAVAERAQELVVLAGQVAAATDYTTAEGHVERMFLVANELVAGRDVSGDGQIGWGGGEGGLEHIEQHVGLLLAGEGIQ
jgi:hypothetical protein